MAVPTDISGSLLRSGNLILGRYELIRELGRGGMGVVWLARDRTLKIDLAFKFLPDILRQDKVSLDELRDEAVRNLRLTNEHIVRTYDFIEGEGVAGITMEYVDGPTLAGLKLERPNKHLEAGELLPLIRGLCEALHYAHTQPKVVHRDLKPANLMVTRDGRLKVTDFGIARSICDSISRVSNAQPTSGTLMFMSPQQLMGEPPRPSDDIYSVGATIYDLLTSKPPFYSGSIHAQVIGARAPSMAERRAQLERGGANLPPEWEEVVGACLAKEPGDRPATALEIIRRLEVAMETMKSVEVSTVAAVTKPAPAAPPPPPPQAPQSAPAAQSIHVLPPPQPGAFKTTPLPPPPAPAMQPRSKAGWMLGLLILGALILVGAVYLALTHGGSRGVSHITPTPEPYVPPAATPAPPPAVLVQPGRIVVNTIPSGARVWIDDSDVGTTPKSVGELEPGEHRVRLEKTGYEPLDLTVHVESGGIVDRGALSLVLLPPPPPTTPVPKPVVTGLSDIVARDLATRYVSNTKLRNIPGLLECYDDPVDYHDEGYLDRAKLRESISAYFRDWPYFDISVLGVNVAPTNDPNVKTVTVDYRFLAKKGSKTSSGVAHDVLTVRRAGDGALILRFRQTVTERKKNF